jgi:hypothetical protein
LDGIDKFIVLAGEEDSLPVIVPRFGLRER